MICFISYTYMVLKRGQMHFLHFSPFDRGSTGIRTVSAINSGFHRSGDNSLLHCSFTRIHKSLDA